MDNQFDEASALESEPASDSLKDFSSEEIKELRELAERTPPAIDDDLASLVNSVNSIPTAHIGVVLFVKGLVISGNLIGGRQYFSKYGALMDMATGDSAGTYYSSIKSIIEEKYPEERTEEPIFESTKRSMLVTYIHLDEARVFVPGHPSMPNNGMLWRGKLSEVDGWSFGSMNTQ